VSDAQKFVRDVLAQIEGLKEQTKNTFSKMAVATDALVDELERGLDPQNTTSLEVAAHRVRLRLIELRAACREASRP
jgi:hypothetical protein